MALREIFDAVLARTTLIFGGDLDVRFGISEDNRHGAPPEIVVYPLSGSITPSKNNGRNPTQMFTREVVCVAKIWAEDIDQAESLFNNFAEAMQEAAVTSWIPESEEWDDAKDAESGTRLTVRFRVFVPLITTARKTVTVTEWQNTGVITGSV